MSGECFQPVLPVGMNEREEQVRRLGFLGGSFDPVHLGHLMAAQDAFESMALEKVVFVPTAQSPLKEAIPGITDEDRLALLWAAIGQDGRFDISMSEINRGGVSYTIDTVDVLTDENPDARLFWIIGADQAASLSGWHRIDELAVRVEFIVLDRPGYNWRGSGPEPGIRLHPIKSRLLDISSSEIRRRARAGLSLKNLVPEEVASEISRLHLYQ